MKNDLVCLESRAHNCEKALPKAKDSTERLSRPLAARRSRLREEKQSLQYRNPASQTECEVLNRSILLRVINFYSHSWKKWFLDKPTQEKIARELLESQAEIDRKHAEIEQEERDLLQEGTDYREKTIGRYVKQSIGNPYSKQYLRMIRIAKEHGIVLYEYFLREYPPDWEDRAAAVRLRDAHTCQKCGARQGNLAVHHKTPVNSSAPTGMPVKAIKDEGNTYYDDGRVWCGNHYLDNLVTLCNECHMRQHPSVMRDRQKLLDSAEEI